LERLLQLRELSVQHLDEAFLLTNRPVDRLKLLNEERLLLGQRGVHHRVEQRPLRLRVGELTLQPADARLHCGNLLLNVQGPCHGVARDSKTEPQPTESRDDQPRHARYSSVRHERSVTMPSFESVSMSASASS
jgi:hypothetical protein